MTGYLVDTIVLSELVRPVPEPRVAALLTRERDLWLSVVTLHELVYGAEQIAEPARRGRLSGWIETVKFRFGARIVAVDEAVAEQAGRMRAGAAAVGRTADPLDVLVAATARVRSMTLATRNVKDFAALDVIVFNPWA